MGADILKTISIPDCINYVSQFTVKTYCFADGRCLFKQPQSVSYIPLESV